MKQLSFSTIQKYRLRILLIVLLVVLCILTLPPKRSVIGGLGGFWGPGKTAYREDYTCIGLNVGLPPPPGTADGDITHLCFGVLINRVCSIESVTDDNRIVRTPVACRN